MKTLLSCAVVLLLSCGSAAGQVVIQDVRWQLALQLQKQKKEYHGLERWLFPPSQKWKMRTRAVVTLLNKGGKTGRAAVLRYAFSARLRRIGQEGEGAWTLPFILEERHVPLVRKDASVEVPVYPNRVEMDSYLRRVYAMGYWPDMLSVRVVLNPQPGETFDERVREKSLEIIWKTAPGSAEPHE
ncbi:MAG: hypothetical protein WC728_10010 [Elusimicrobiota bacterium]